LRGGSVRARPVADGCPGATRLQVIRIGSWNPSSNFTWWTPTPCGSPHSLDPPDGLPDIVSLARRRAWYSLRKPTGGRVNGVCRSVSKACKPDFVPCKRAGAIQPECAHGKTSLSAASFALTLV